MSNYFSGCNGTTCNSSLWMGCAIISATLALLASIYVDILATRSSNAVRCNGHCYPLGYKECFYDKTICSNETVVIKKEWEK